MTPLLTIPLESAERMYRGHRYYHIPLRQSALNKLMFGFSVGVSDPLSLRAYQEQQAAIANYNTEHMKSLTEALGLTPSKTYDH